MADILKHTEGNIAGLIPVWWVFASDVETQTIDKKTLWCDIVLKNAVTWNFMYATPDTIEFRAEESDKPGGTQYTYKMKFMVPKDRSSVEITLREMNRRGIIVHATDKNGTVRILGTTENPMRKLGKLDKPASADGFNGWEITLFGEFSLPAFYGDAMPDSIGYSG